MSEQRPSHPAPPAEAAAAHARALADPEGFWSEAARELDWSRPWDQTLSGGLAEGRWTWFLGGRLNASHNCLDRHVASWRRRKAAVVWEGEPPGHGRTMTYQELFSEVNRLANALKARGVKPGDRVGLYLPMVPEAVAAMLACARLGAPHVVVFASFSAGALRQRLNDVQARVLITADGFHRSGRVIPLKPLADEALRDCPTVESVLVVRRAGLDAPMTPVRDAFYDEALNHPSAKGFCRPVEVDAGWPLFILHATGSSGQPLGVVHATGGYLVHAAATTRLALGVGDDDAVFCTADVGWITGHTYAVYGPLALGATVVIYEGLPTHPRPDRIWEIVERHGASVLYTSPSVLRAAIREDEAWIVGRDLSSLRLLASVGEPLPPDLWRWYSRLVGANSIPLLDTWWQTETGGIVIAPIPGLDTPKPGATGRPFFGVEAAVVREDGQPCQPNEGGYLVIKRPFPGLASGIHGQPRRFALERLGQFPGAISTGDAARVDEDGQFWILGRVDDVITVAGQKLGTAEVEAALVSHPAVAEAAVVGYPHPVKGQAVCAFVTLKMGHPSDEAMAAELAGLVSQRIGSFAAPDQVRFAANLPKTRAGKILRSILKQAAADPTRWPEEDIGPAEPGPGPASGNRADAPANGRKR